ncbi:hypothetical protein BU16DRAFT_621033 [Lophium mytilinum]|uniref:F-box domain-containing protein n=1 Tax=Lophium mytilinum TaxID=390894 RepID=A0A6A6QHD0_9PEZI|nr:hypothetical protein BU16DRAFT_621033 [Lophium mytilinum]
MASNSRDQHRMRNLARILAVFFAGHKAVVDMKKSSTPSPSKPKSISPGFLDLPAELRIEIYRHCLSRDSFIDLFLLDDHRRHEVRPPGMGFLGVSSQIRFEAGDVLSRQTTFQYRLNYDGGELLERKLGPDDIAHICNLQLVLEGGGKPFIDIQLWSPILARLTKLVIVAKQHTNMNGFFHSIGPWPYNTLTNSERAIGGN